MQHCRACDLRDEIDAALAIDGSSKSGVAKAFKIPKTTLLRHLTDHTRRPGNPRTAIHALAMTGAPMPPGAPQAPKDTFSAEPEVLLTICTICVSSDRRDIEAALMRGATYASIDKAHDFDAGSTGRHARRCCPSLLAVAGDAAAKKNPDDRPQTALERAVAAADSARQLMEDAEAETDIRLRATGLMAVAKAIETLGKLNGELGPDQEAKIAASAQWSKAKILIIAALKPYPAALKAVGLALREAEAV